MKFFPRLRVPVPKLDTKISKKDTCISDQDIEESRQNKSVVKKPARNIAGTSAQSLVQPVLVEASESKKNTADDKPKIGNLAKPGDKQSAVVEQLQTSIEHSMACEQKQRLAGENSFVSKSTQRGKKHDSKENGQQPVPIQSFQRTTGELSKLRRELDSLRKLVGLHESEAQNFASQMLNQAQQFQQDHNRMVQKLTKYELIRQQNRELYNQIQDMRGHIRVICRIRPSSSKEDLAVLSTQGQLGLDQVEVLDKNKQWKSFTFDRVLGPETTQPQIYSELAPLLRSVLDGFSVCIFAYGQTSSGKTYTMSGPSDSPKTEANKGLQYRVLDDLFLQAKERASETEYFMSVQMLEIYNDNLRDLLNSSGSTATTGLKSSSDIRLVDGIVNTRKIEVRSTDDVVKVMAEGERIRAVGSTALNSLSSRSHQVVTIVIEGRDTLTGDGTRAKLQLVDLAGSERVAISQAEGDRLKEAQYINKSLSALGDVVSSLQNRNQHIPFRNSRLTQVLQDSMTGSAKMVMLMHVSPEMSSSLESLSTLAFGVRAAQVERTAPVKTALSVPLNTSQMKQVMEDLERKTKELEDQSSEMEQVKQSSDSASKILQSKNKEMRELTGALASSRAEVAQLEDQVARLKRQTEKATAAVDKPDRALARVAVATPPRTHSPARPSSLSSAAPRTAPRTASSRRSLPTSTVARADAVKENRKSLERAVARPKAWESPAVSRRPVLSSTTRQSRPQSAPPATHRPKPRITQAAPGTYASPASKSTLHSRADSHPTSTFSTSRLGSTSSLASGTSKFRSKSKPSSALGSRNSSNNTSPRHNSSPANRSNTEQFNRLTKPKTVAKLDARFAERDAYGNPIVSSSGTGGSVEYSAEAAARTEEAAAERRREQEEHTRKLRLKRIAQERPQAQDSKIKGITDFDTLLLEAESQLARLAGSSTQTEGEVKDGATEDAVAVLAKKISKVEEEATETGALDGKNEKERIRLIQKVTSLIGHLESDNIVSTNMESRLEKSRQIKRCKQLIASLEMAAMTCWSSNAWG